MMVRLVTPSGKPNYLEFGKTRIDLDARAEHAIMGALFHQTTRVFYDAEGRPYEIVHAGDGEFTLSSFGGPTFATIKGPDAHTLMRDLRAVIMGE